MNMENKTYDSTADTLKHIKRVSELLNEAAMELLRRANVHDNSKLIDPEKAYFDKWTPELEKVTYGTPEYFSMLKELKPALDHHYANNSHHPQFYPNGIKGMDLFDLIEMFFDWRAATERTKGGDIKKSIDFNKERFSMSDDLAEIFKNTARNLNY